MITAVKADNVDAYKLLFEEASDILSGFERVQTYDSEKNYYYKDANTKEYKLFIFDASEESDKLVEFADALVEYKIMYTPILNTDGSEKGPVAGFAPELGITTLEEYYNWLPDLKMDKNGNPTKYTVLPLDEPHFVINANTRAINVPADFKKNGIAVQGDDLAEIVYFEIDRYYDAMDLNNCEIYIQWETPKNAEGKVIKSISDIYIRDIESQPGKLIFGWAISDAITVTSGSLKFSVKFLQWDESTEGKKSIAYSLNTLTAQVPIQQSIGIDLEKDTYIPDNANDRLLERIQESEVVGGLQAAVPYFIENIEKLPDGYDIVPNHTNGTLKIYGVARADDTGAVSYLWKKRELNLDNSSQESEVEIPNSSKTEMVPVTEMNGDYPVLKDKHVYYLATDDNSYIPYEGGKSIEDLTSAYPEPDKVPTFYERKAVLEVTEAGIYTLEARNRIFNSISKARSNSAVFKCPAPINIDNSKQSFEGHIIGEKSAILNPPFDSKSIGDLTYQWYKAEDIKSCASRYEVDGMFDTTQVAYGEEIIRVAFANDAPYTEQDVNTEGTGAPNTNSFYFPVKIFVPEGAVYLREGECGLNKSDGSGITNKDDIIWDDFTAEVAKVPGGVDSLGRKYRVFWLPAAAKGASGGWTYYGANSTPERYIGWARATEWYDANGNKISTDYVRIQLSNEDIFEPFGLFAEIEGAEADKFEASEEGLYKLEITRTRNRRSISEESIEYRVTNAPEIPVFTDEVYAGAVIVSANDLIAGTEVFNIELEDSVKFDQYEITWKLYRGDSNPPASDVEIYKEYITDTVATFNPLSADFDSIFENLGIEDKDGRYYALVRNKRNGHFSKSTTKPEANNMFVVTGYEKVNN